MDSYGPNQGLELKCPSLIWFFSKLSRGKPRHPGGQKQKIRCWSFVRHISSMGLQFNRVSLHSSLETETENAVQAIMWRFFFEIPSNSSNFQFSWWLLILDVDILSVQKTAGMGWGEKRCAPENSVGPRSVACRHLGLFLPTDLGSERLRPNQPTASTLDRDAFLAYSACGKNREPWSCHRFWKRMVGRLWLLFFIGMVKTFQGYLKLRECI